jgi:hypothetical protein
MFPKSLAHLFDLVRVVCNFATHPIQRLLYLSVIATATPQQKAQCHCLVCGNKFVLHCFRLSDHLHRRILAAVALVTPNSDMLSNI